MKAHLSSLVSGALTQLQTSGLLACGDVRIDIERARDRQHGDFACNVALALAKAAGCRPRELAERIVAQLAPSPRVAKVEIAGPGFINFFLTQAAWQGVVSDILAAGQGYGRSLLGAGLPAQVEFVSANPNGPLHVGHGRGAAIGSVIANLLDAVGFAVQREYYVNDAGRQMDILTVSIWLRYLELCAREPGGTEPGRLDQEAGPRPPVVFPVNGYQGEYVRAIAASLRDTHGEALWRPAEQVSVDLPPDATPGGSGDREAHIDALIVRAQTLLGTTAYRAVFDRGLHTIVADIRADLAEFGVHYDAWFSERSLTASGAVDAALARLRDAGHLYQEGGAWWFRSTAFGDEKDRVVVRDNGQKTYFASDIAYHIGKLDRGFARVVDVWGADHHGYVPRIRAALAALGYDAQRLEVVLVQFAILYRGRERAQMSTRSGEFVTLRELRSEVGNDAARFFYVLRKSDQHLDFDLELAKSRSNENPVFYVQYAHARICSVFRQAAERGLVRDLHTRGAHVQLLVEEHEQRLLGTLARYPELLEQAALAYEPHQLAYYVRELATDFHTYYNAHAFLVDDACVRAARLDLLEATRQVLAAGLQLLGVSAPESM